MPPENPLGTEQDINPRGFDVGATSPLGSVPGPTTPPPNLSTPAAPPQLSPAQVMSQQLQAADTQHHSALGKAFRSIMGNDVSYQINPQTGKMEQTETPQKPGQFWRGIIAATVLGGATAAKNKAPGFIQGAAEGGEAVVDKSEQQDKLKRQQAQDQFKDQLAARSANTEEDLKRAQIAMHNAHTLHENQIMQREDYSFHKDVADHGKKQLQPFIDADPTLVKFQDIPETQMTDLLKNNPDSQHLLWEPTGTRIVIGADGKPNVEATYSGVDPSGKVKITKDQIDVWKKAGIDQIYPKDWEDVLKPGKELTATQYMAVNQKSQELANKQLITKKEKMSEEEQQAKIGLEKAQAAHWYADAAKIKKEGGDKAKAEKTYIDAADALDKLVKDGKGFDDLPIRYQDALADHSQAEAKDKGDMLKTMIAAGQYGTKEAADLYKEWTNLTSVHTRTQVNKAKQTPLSGAGGDLSKVGQDYVNKHFAKMSEDSDTLTPIKGDDKDAGIDLWSDQTIPPDQKMAITRQTGVVVPWFAVEEFSSKTKITPEEGARQLKAAGIKVGEKTTSRQPNIQPTFEQQAFQ